MNQWLTLQKLQKFFIFVAIISFFKYIKTQSYKFFIITEFFKNCFKKRLTTAIFLSSLNDRLLTITMTLPKVDRRLVNGLKSRTFSRSSSLLKGLYFWQILCSTFDVFRDMWRGWEKNIKMAICVTMWIWMPPTIRNLNI